MPDDDRQRLAEQQANLVAALTGAQPLPANFEADKLALAARSLLKKRTRGVERAWAATVTALGPRFADLFAEFCRGRGAADDHTTDGLHFARWLHARGDLPDAGRLELLRNTAARGFPVRLIKLSKRRALAVRCLGRVHVVRF